MGASPEAKAAKAFIAAARSRIFSPVEFVRAIRLTGGYAEELLRQTAITVFRFAAIDHKYGFGDRRFNEVAVQVCRIIDGAYPPPHNPPHA